MAATAVATGVAAMAAAATATEIRRTAALDMRSSIPGGRRAGTGRCATRRVGRGGGPRQGNAVNDAAEVLPHLAIH
ncbi:hypothetical protein GCM10010278_73440 [Streptomyces melanogenes]|nr:hypothetical protein GCM10010278_73440 [Streptomyces melanogenes]